MISDDRRFLSLLMMHGTLFLTPADLLVVMARQGILTKVEAREALDRLRSAILLAAYWGARQDLETKGEHYEEK